MNRRDCLPLRNNHGLSRTGFIFGILFLMLAATGLGVFLGYHIPGLNFPGGVRRALGPPFGGRDVVRILVLGEDNTGGSESKPRGLSDTIILLSVNLADKHLAALSIPRDTRVDLDGYGGVCKINAAHVHGGPSLTALAVENLVGIRSDYYVKTNVEGFKKSVDILGGVEIDVEKNMRYRDRRGGLYINLKKGPQLLYGDKAMQYARFRHDALGDIARIQRQQKLLKALANKALMAENLPKLPRLINAILENVETDLSPRDAIYLAKFAKQVDLDQVEMATLPGTPQTIGGASYWIADPTKTTEVVRKIFFPELVADLPKVEVLNGSGIGGAAQEVADALKHQGYEVTSVGNASSFDYESSEVISRKKGAQGLERIAALVNSIGFREIYDPSAKAEVTVIVGRDCPLITSGG